MRYSHTLEVKPVRNGHGIVALTAFAAGATICRIRGGIVSARKVWRYWQTNRRLAENCFRYDDDHYLNPEGEIGAYANHSCRPNAGIVKTPNALWLKAVRAIKAGDEVTHDYSTLLGADDIWRMRCSCGEANCRRTVRNVNGLPAKVRAGYAARGMIPAFILTTVDFP